jgi:DNA-directed RNA polymerase specialized sigma24 family protein/anti-sigma factor RsiW
MGARRGGGERGPGLGGRSGPGAGGKGGGRRRRKAPAAGRTLSVAEAQFYARVYDPARKGSLAELRRRGCDEQEAEDLFAAAYAAVMESVDPIERRFDAPQMVQLVKRACWRRLVDERRRLVLREEPGAKPRPLRRESPVESPPELAEEREAVAIGREALATLSGRDRLIFLRRQLLGMLPEEILAETPGLSRRTYRKVIQRANARVREAFERIEAGERCAEIEGGLLHRYVLGESPPAERRAVEAHLAHCGACRQARARMRGHLIDVASGVMLASSLGAGHPGSGVPHVHLLELASQGAQALGEASRAARERLREALLRLAGALPGPGTDAGVSQALGASSWRIASACTTAVAAGACVAAGVVPGIGGVDLSGHQRQHGHTAAPVKQARAESAAPATATSEYAAPAQTTPGSEEASSGSSAKHTATAKREASSSSGGRAATATPASGRQVGTEFGFESGQPAPSSGTSGSSSGSSQGASLSGASEAKHESSGSGGSSTRTSQASAEFGL